MIKASELAEKFLGFAALVVSKPVEPVAPVEGVVAEPPTPVASSTPLTLEQQSKLNRLVGDLRWLVSEGYVTEFIDGRIFAPPAVVEARKKEIEGAEHDPENFPEVPVAETPATAEATAEPVVDVAPIPEEPTPETPAS